MSESKPNIVNNLHTIAQFALFVSSYLPLFILIILKQTLENCKLLYTPDFSMNNISTFASNSVLSIILIVVSFFGWIGFKYTFNNLENFAENGFPAKLIDVKNKNSESIGYIATYIIPFLFQSFNGFYEYISVLFLLVIIYRIYINSTLLLINPILSILYNLYEIEFLDKEIKRNGLILSKNKNLIEDEDIKLYEIGYKLYYSKN